MVLSIGFFMVVFTLVSRMDDYTYNIYIDGKFKLKNKGSGVCPVHNLPRHEHLLEAIIQGGNLLDMIAIRNL